MKHISNPLYANDLPKLGIFCRCCCCDLT